MFLSLYCSGHSIERSTWDVCIYIYRAYPRRDTFFPPLKQTPCRLFLDDFDGYQPRACTGVKEEGGE